MTTTLTTTSNSVASTRSNKRMVALKAIETGLREALGWDEASAASSDRAAAAAKRISELEDCLDGLKPVWDQLKATVQNQSEEISSLSDEIELIKKQLAKPAATKTAKKAKAKKARKKSTPEPKAPDFDPAPTVTDPATLPF